MCSCSSGMGVAHRSHRSPGRGRSRGRVLRIRASTAQRVGRRALRAAGRRGQRTATSGFRPSVDGGRRPPAHPERSALRRRWSRSPARPRRSPARPPCCSVTADDGQPSQLPSSRRCTAPTASSMLEQLDVAAVARRGTAAPSRGRRSTRVARSSGCRPCTTAGCPTSSSSTSRPIERRAPRRDAARRRGPGPPPYSSVTRRSSSSARSHARGSATDSQLVEQRLDPVADRPEVLRVGIDRLRVIGGQLRPARRG